MSIDNIKPYRDPFPSFLGLLVAYRTYLRKVPQPGGTIRMQTWEENGERNASFLSKLGELTPKQQQAIYEQQCNLVVTPPGRVLWAACEEWVNKGGYANYLGLFNCVGVRPTSWRWLGIEFLLLMMGCGVGSIVEEDNVALFPPINERVPKLVITNQPGTYAERPEATTYMENNNCAQRLPVIVDSSRILTIHVGDSKEGWVDAYVKVLETCSDPAYNDLSVIYVNLGGVRSNGEPIKGFGGTANPIGLPHLFQRVIEILQGAAGRKLTAFEVCLLENEAAVCTVAGNVRRSARWGGYSYLSPSMTGAKDNLWYQNEVGKWVVDEARDALRMTNLSAIFHRLPTLEECRESVRKQYESGEGAMYLAAPALVRTNIDLLETKEEQDAFVHAYTMHGRETGRAYLRAKLYEQYGACLVAGTMVLTKAGHYPIETLVGKEVEVWDGEQWVATTFHITGTDQEVYEVIRADGSSITATGYHNFLVPGTTRISNDVHQVVPGGIVTTLLDLKAGDVLLQHGAPLVETLDLPGSPYRGTAYLRGFLLADGIEKDGAIKLHLHTTKKDCMARLVSSTQHDVLDPVQGLASVEGTFRETSRGWWMQGLGKYSSTLLPWVTTYRNGLPPQVYNYTLGEKCHLIAGYFDANGKAVEIGKAFGYVVSFVSERLLLDMQLLLETMGISSHYERVIYEEGNDSGYPYHLHLPRTSSIQLSKLATFATLVSYSGKVLADGGSLTSSHVVAVLPRGRVAEVYCCNVPTNHRFALSNGILIGNCNTSIDVETVERELDHRMQRYGANPCFAAGTMIVTKDGHYPIETLVGEEVEVWDGDQWVTTTFHVTGVNQPIYEITFKDGTSVTATGYHGFVLTDGQELPLLELKPGDELLEHTATPATLQESSPYEGSAYLKGFLLGDGTSSQGGPMLHLYPTKEMCKDRLVENCNRLHTDRVVPKPGTFEPLTEVGWRDSKKGWWMQGLSRHKSLLPWVTTYRNGLPLECYNWSLEEKCDFIAGYFDADGTAVDTKNSYGYQITSVSLQLLQDIQLLLNTMGVGSHLDRKGREGGMRDFNDGYGEYLCNTVYRLSLSRPRSIALAKLVTFTRLASFSDRTVKIGHKYKKEVVSITSKGVADKVYCCNVPTNHRFSLSNGITSLNCVEITGHNFVCSLSQVDLSRFDTASPTLWEDIDAALDTAALIVCSLLKRGFDIPELQESREVDPIVAVTLNGVFDFLVQLWGEPWLRWWMAGSPEYWRDPLAQLDGFYDVETGYGGWHSQKFIQDTKWMLNRFRDSVSYTVDTYCTEHGLRIPNRYTAIQPSGSKSCLTGGTPACYTPKGQYWIRRVTLRRDHPVALAAIDWGYNVVPSTSCKDDSGGLLDDPYDDRVTEWLVEVPEKCVWSTNMETEYDVANAPITSQWYLTMAVQRHYVTHNTSVTLDINEDEVDTLAGLIHKEIHGGGDYISAAIFARDGYTMPRMPYEPITRQQYDEMVAKVEARRMASAYDNLTFKGLVEYYYNLDAGAEMGPTAGCDGDSCTLPTLPYEYEQPVWEYDQDWIEGRILEICSEIATLKIKRSDIVSWEEYAEDVLDIDNRISGLEYELIELGRQLGDSTQLPS